MPKTRSKAPHTKEQHEHMAMRQRQRRDAGLSKGEAWVYERLVKTGVYWTRDAIWGWRLFDFWSAKLGINVEADGPEHDKEDDAARDRSLFERSGIIVLRVPYYDEEKMDAAIQAIKAANTWLERRTSLGLLTKAEQRRLARE